MTDRLELNWKLDGFVDEQRYYCSETPIDPLSLPTPKAVLAGDVRNYVDYVGDFGKKYYIRIGAVKDTVEKISEEVEAVFGNVWNPDNLVNPAKLWHSGDSATYDTQFKVSSLSNLSHEAIDYVQSISSKQPLLTKIGDSNGIKFDGIDDNLSTTVRNITNAASKVWFFFVGRIKSTATTQIIYTFLNSNPGTRIGINVDSGKIVINGRLGVSSALTVFLSQAIPEDEYFMLFLSVDFSSKETIAILNGFTPSAGSIATSGSLENANSSGNPILGSTVESTLYLNATICSSMLSFNSKPTQTEIDKLFGWAAHKYGLTDNLPNDHPYKILVPTI